MTVQRKTIQTFNRMNFKLENKIRPNINKLQAYSSAREDFIGNADIFLDANENPYNNGINRYPDPFQSELKQIISNIKSVITNNIFLGNGSDEVLDIAMRTFCEPMQDNIIICPPTYGMYKVLADINNIETREVLLKDDFNIDIDGILRVANDKTKMLILCSPNNPTASSIPLQEIEFLLQNLNSIILLDEAYIDFSDKESAVCFINKYPNLIVSQTLSKAYGMAGLRIGIALADSKIIDVFNKVKPPYNINTLSQNKAVEILLQERLYNEKLRLISKEKTKLRKTLTNSQLVEKVFPSDANFLLVKFKNAKYVYKKLTDKGIVVRDRSNQPFCDNCLRITVGTELENKILIEELNKI